jgi:chemotaxis protein methyltransferase WspC
LPRSPGWLVRNACTHPEGVLSLLSLPCSTGEEPYSIAMALLDAGVPANRFRVDAVDISARSLALGMRAVYGRNSFRGGELGFRDRHFESTPDGYSLKETVRRQVHFQQGNLFAADLLPGVGIYDAIFFRNVLIYFDRPTQDRALEVMNRLLHANGVLLVAPAETRLPASHDLVSTHEPLAFAFRKSGVRSPVENPNGARPVMPVALRRLRAPAGSVRHAASAASKARAAAAALGGLALAQPADPAADLSDATRLADQGHFVEAANSCEEHLRRCGPSAGGVLSDGPGAGRDGKHAEAATYYRKALYLDANHYDSQIHLAFLMEKQGDLAAAQVLRNRAPARTEVT